MNKTEYYITRRAIRTAIKYLKTYEKDKIMKLLRALMSEQMVKVIRKNYRKLLYTLHPIDHYISELPMFHLLFTEKYGTDIRFELYRQVCNSDYKFRCPEHAKKFLQIHQLPDLKGLRSKIFDLTLKWYRQCVK